MTSELNHASTVRAALVVLVGGRDWEQSCELPVWLNQARTIKESCFSLSLQCFIWLFSKRRSTHVSPSFDKWLPTDQTALLSAIEDSTSSAYSNKQTKIHGRHCVISVWKCFKKPPLLKRTAFGRHSIKTTRGLYNPSYTSVTHCNTDTPATDVHVQLSFQYDSYYSSPVHWTVVSMDRVCLRRSVSFMKRDGMVSGCVFILLHSHGSSWKRLSKNSCQNDDKPHYHMHIPARFTTPHVYCVGLPHTKWV